MHSVRKTTTTSKVEIPEGAKQEEHDIVMCQVPADIPFAPTARPDGQWLCKSFLKGKIYRGRGGGAGGWWWGEASQKIEED